MTKPFKKRINKYFLAIKALALVVIPLWLLILPKTSFDNHTQTICLFTRLTSIECYGCGLTRACMRLIHLDFYAAWQFNKISFIVFPILCFLLLQEIYQTTKTIFKLHNDSRK